MFNAVNMSDRILVLDIAQPSNSGDEAMQRALLHLCLDKLSKEVVAMAYFGENEFPAVEAEFDHYPESIGVEVVGGVSKTFLWSRHRKLRKVALRVWNALLILSFYAVSSAGGAGIARRVFFDRLQRRSLAHFEACDYVVWNGRNFRGSSSWLGEILKIFELLAHPLIAIALNKPIYGVGSSVWALKGAISRALLRHVVRRCEKFWVRERESYEVMNGVLLGDTGRLERMPDLSFFTLNSVLSSGSSATSRQDGKIVAMTLVGRKEFQDASSHERYLRALARLVAHIGSRGFCVRLVPQVSYALEPYNEEADFIMKSNPQVHIDTSFGGQTLEELVSIYSNARILVGSRMHSIIFSVAAGTPALGLSYDSGSKWAILEDFGDAKPFVLDASELDEDRLQELFDSTLLSGRGIDPGKLQALALRCESVFSEIGLHRARSVR